MPFPSCSCVAFCVLWTTKAEAVSVFPVVSSKVALQSRLAENLSEGGVCE